jgi:hypothetical protein
MLAMFRRLRKHYSIYLVGVVVFAAGQVWSIAQLATHSPNSASIYYLLLAAACFYPLIACAYHHGRRHRSQQNPLPTIEHGGGYVFEDVTGGDYDWKRLIDVYLLATRTHIHEDFEVFYRSLLGHLESLFGIRVVPETDDDDMTIEKQAIAMLMRSTIKSYHEGTSPMAGYLESGLLVSKLQETGEDGLNALALVQEIGELYGESKRLHLTLIQKLFVMIHGEPNRVVTSEELQAAGFDDSRAPKVSDYWEYA